MKLSIHIEYIQGKQYHQARRTESDNRKCYRKLVIRREIDVRLQSERVCAQKRTPLPSFSDRGVDPEEQQAPYSLCPTHFPQAGNPHPIPTKR